MTLEVSARHRLGAFALDAAFSSDGALTALFGQSGSGKTTLVNLIGGLIRPDSAKIVMDGEVLVDTDRGRFVPTHRRRVGYVFQEGRLFPHLTVRQNLTYGRWFAPREERSAGFDHIVELLGIGDLLGRRPAGLSGGEKQRVAIGRALLASPRLLLMDEPLASLDEARKSEIFPYIERLRDEARVPIVYVSHSVEEVARLATTVAVLAEGKVVAAGPVSEIMARLDLFPLTGAAEAGAVLEARIAAHDVAEGVSRLDTAAGPIRVPLLDASLGSHLRLRVRARDVMVAVKRPEGISALNVLPGAIAAIGGEAGPLALVRIDCGGAALVAQLTRKSVRDLGLVSGREVYAIVKSVTFERRGIGRFDEPHHGSASADS